MPLTMTQDAYDEYVLGIADFQTDLADNARQLRKQDDPAAWYREEENMMLMNILDALKFYDVDADILTDDEVDFYFELATLISENCPV